MQFHARVPRAPLDEAVTSIWVFESGPRPHGLEKVLPFVGGDFKGVVHNKQSLRVHAKLPASGTLTSIGKVLGVYGGPGRNLGEFGWIHAIACPSENEIWVGELINWRVQKLVTKGTAKPRSSAAPKRSSSAAPASTQFTREGGTCARTRRRSCRR